MRIISPSLCCWPWASLGLKRRCWSSWGWSRSVARSENSSHLCFSYIFLTFNQMLQTSIMLYRCEQGRRSMRQACREFLPLVIVAEVKAWWFGGSLREDRLQGRLMSSCQENLRCLGLLALYCLSRAEELFNAAAIFIL